MRKVAVVGVGATKFKARWIEKTYFELAFDAVKEALNMAGIGKDDVESVVYGIYNEFFQRQFMPELFTHDYLGFTFVPATRVAAGGATGGAAVRTAFMEVASGAHDVVAVVGLEKCTDCWDYDRATATPEVLRSIAYSIDMTYEYPLGAFAAAEYALPTVAHIEKFGGPTEEQMAMVSVKNHGNAMNNPLAQSGKEITVEDVMNSRMICYPFKFYDNCLYTEGAAALILASEDRAREITDKPVFITGVGSATDMGFPGFKTGRKSNIWEFGSTRVAGERAYRMAGIKNPRKELDVVEIHDAFTAAELLSYEAFGFCEPGGGGRLIEEGVTWMDGELPVCPSGGLIGCGHAVGATGVMQTGEAVLQLRGEADRRQVKNARKALVQSIGGVACAYTVAMVLERGE
ncbi:MAG: thiolase family protein [bacterium]